MFKRLKLTNFRQHEALTVDFTPGLNAIKGRNEGGKSTCVQAIAYAMFGSKSLPESFENVVRWGEKQSSLKVELELQSGHVFKRGKSGAEIWIAGDIKPLVTGQDECSRYAEALIGASRTTTTSLMMARQKEIEGALGEKDAAAVKLIETLANFKLIDQIVTLVLEHVPNGSTTLTEQRIASLEAEIAQPEEDDGLAGVQAAFDETQRRQIAALGTKTEAEQAVQLHMPKAEEARRLQRELDVLQQREHDANTAHLAAKGTLERLVVPEPPDATETERLRKALEEFNDFAAQKAAWLKLQSHKDAALEWDEGLEALQAARRKAFAEEVASSAEIARLSKEITKRETQLIKDKSCALCQKDLTDVPEVVALNAKLDGELVALVLQLVPEEAKHSAAEETITDLGAVLALHETRSVIYARYEKYLKLDTQYVPARWTWIGADMESPPTDPTAKLREQEAAQRAYDSATGAKLQATHALQTAKSTLQTITAQLDEARQRAAGAQAVLDHHDGLASAVAAAAQTFDAAAKAHNVNAQELLRLQTLREGRATARKRLYADLETAKADLAHTGKGNTLLKKLRAARPQIADQLWRVVLSAVSVYFTQIRGVASVVTRADSEFLVDGHAITGLSGSAMDALGLAIRIALTKTFLPNARFMVLDEPAAACSDERETSMLGLVAAADFDQVLLVTHSALADAFAQNVIQL